MVVIFWIYDMYNVSKSHELAHFIHFRTYAYLEMKRNLIKIVMAASMDILRTSIEDFNISYLHVLEYLVWHNFI